MANDLGALLCAFIARREMTEEAFAEKVGVAKSTISKLKTRPPSIKTLAALPEWIKVLRLSSSEANELIEAAHLARSTLVVQSLVSRLHRKISQMSENERTLLDQTRLLEQECIRHGIELPQLGDDPRPVD